MQTWNKEIVKGDTFKGAQFEIIVNDAPKNLSGVSIKVQFRQYSKFGTVVKTLEIGSGITVLNAASGTFKMDEFDVDFKVGKNYYDIEITESTGEVKTYLQGYFNVLQDVTV